MNKSLIKKTVKEQTGSDCTIQTFYCNSEYGYVEGETLAEFKKNLREKGLRYSELNHTYRLVEIYLPDKDDRWEWCEGNTLSEAYSKIYNLIRKN